MSEIAKSPREVTILNPTKDGIINLFKLYPKMEFEFTYNNGKKTSFFLISEENYLPSANRIRVEVCQPEISNQELISFEDIVAVNVRRETSTMQDMD